MAFLRFRSTVLKPPSRDMILVFILEHLRVIDYHIGIAVLAVDLMLEFEGYY
jgi:hypothetical protein